MANMRSAAGWIAAAGLGYLGWRALVRLREESLAGEVALVTGGSRGLGLLIARELASEGCRLAICARDEVELQRARKEIADLGAEVLAIRCDVASREEVGDMIARVTEHYGRIDLVVNNASIIQVGPVESMTLDDFERAMAVNFWGTVHTSLAVLPQMRERGKGRICNITSIGGKVAVPHLLPYDCAKFAAVGFSEGLHAECGKDGIRVTTIVPGLMRTGSPMNALFKGRAEEEMAWFSLGASTPATAMSAERAARRIVRAIKQRESHVVLTWQAKLLRAMHDIAPSATTEILAIVDRMLPRPDGAGEVKGMEVAQASPVGGIVDRQAEQTNQYGGARPPIRGDEPGGGPQG